MQSGQNVRRDELEEVTPGPQSPTAREPSTFRSSLNYLGEFVDFSTAQARAQAVFVVFGGVLVAISCAMAQEARNAKRPNRQP